MAAQPIDFAPDARHAVAQLGTAATSDAQFGVLAGITEHVVPLPAETEAPLPPLPPDPVPAVPVTATLMTGLPLGPPPEQVPVAVANPEPPIVMAEQDVLTVPGPFAQLQTELAADKISKASAEEQDANAQGVTSVVRSA